MLRALLLVSTLSLVIGQGYDIQRDSNFPLQKCLGCICQASTGCNYNQGCHNAGPSAYFCGPYLISWAYWAEAGKPGSVPNNPQAFETCLKTFKCSEETIYGYMRKWLHDCDRDGDIDCDDVSSVHKAGPHGCNSTWFYKSDYWKLYEQCYYY